MAVNIMVDTGVANVAVGGVEAISPVRSRTYFSEVLLPDTVPAEASHHVHSATIEHRLDVMHALLCDVKKDMALLRVDRSKSLSVDGSDGSSSPGTKLANHPGTKLARTDSTAVNVGSESGTPMLQYSKIASSVLRKSGARADTASASSVLQSSSSGHWATVLAGVRGRSASPSRKMSLHTFSRGTLSRISSRFSESVSQAKVCPHQIDGSSWSPERSMRAFQAEEWDTAHEEAAILIQKVWSHCVLTAGPMIAQSS